MILQTGGGARRGRRRGVIRSLFASALVASLVACTPAPWREMPEAEASLGEAVAAIYFSPQGYDFVGPGFVVLVSPDGSTSAVRTSGMDVGKLVWTDAGLFFSDTERDYLLSDSLRAWVSPKTNYQVAAIPVGDGARVLSLFNDGNDEAGYIEQVVDSDGRSSVLTEVFGYNRALALCGETLVGISEVTGVELTKLAAKKGVAKTSVNDFPQMLTRLYPKPATGADTLIAAEQMRMLEYPTNIAPCKGDAIIYLTSIALTSIGVDDPFQNFIGRWNTVTGVSERRELQTADGVPVEISLDEFVRSTMSSTLTEDGRLLWFGGDGVVRATDPGTGLTSELWDSGLPVDDAGMTEPLFQGRWLYLLDVPNDDVAQPLVLHRRDRMTGEGGPVLTIPGLNQRRSLRHVLRGIAVAPSMNK